MKSIYYIIASFPGHIGLGMRLVPFCLTQVPQQFMWYYTVIMYDNNCTAMQYRDASCTQAICIALYFLIAESMAEVCR